MYCIVCVCISIYWGYARKSNKSDAQTLYAFSLFASSWGWVLGSFCFAFSFEISYAYVFLRFLMLLHFYIRQVSKLSFDIRTSAEISV